MNTSLAIQPDELETIQRTGRMLAMSGYFDAKGDGPQAIAQIATKIMAGREIGIGPFAAVNGIHIISGKPSIGANLLASAVKGSGRYDYRVREMTAKVCRIEFFQRVGDKWESLGVSEFTEEEARKASTKNMDKFPKNMLFARAMSNGVRFYVPDVFNGNAVYVPEELGAEVDSNGEVIESTAVRVVNTATGEITATAPSIPSIVAEWLNQAQPAEAAKLWAVEVGSCSNVHEARNSLQNVVNDHGAGRLTTENKTAILVAFYEKHQEKLAKAADAAVTEAEPMAAF